jgi:hypothetical protein
MANPPQKTNGSANSAKDVTEVKTVITPEDTVAKSAVPGAPKDYDAKNDPALIAAWRRFLDYDRVSTEQKNSYVQFRKYVIIFSFITSAVAVLSAFLKTDPNNIIVSFFSIFTSREIAVTWVEGLFRVLLVILPIVTVGINYYSAQFASSTAWIEYRVGAETIRQKIYLFRLRAGEFANIPSVQDRQRKLLDVLNQTDERIDKAGATLPYMQKLESNETIQTKANGKSQDKDDGFTNISVDYYLNSRIRAQMDWYANRIESDHGSMKRYRLWALAIAGLGSVLAGLGMGIEAFVAITTAAGVGLNMWADTRMFGRTYATYHLTASRLRNELNRWEILTPDQKKDEAAKIKIVTDMEDILAQEREAWRGTSIELQANVDRQINSRLNIEGNKLAIADKRATSLDDYPALAIDPKEYDPDDKTPNEPLPPDDDEPMPNTSASGSGFPGAGG